MLFPTLGSVFICVSLYMCLFLMHVSGAEWMVQISGIKQCECVCVCVCNCA